MGKVQARDYPTAVRMFRFLAGEGMAEAFLELGLLYRVGLGCEADPELATKLTEEAARRGNVAAKFYRGYELYERGEFEAALVYARDSATAGDYRASALLGIMYSNGFGVEREDTASVRYHQVAAEAGLAASQYSLGYDLVEGVGVAKDLRAGVQWIRKAALQHYPPALQGLLSIYKALPDLIESQEEFEALNVMAISQIIPDEMLARTLGFEEFLGLARRLKEGGPSPWLEDALDFWQRHRSEGS